MTLLRYGNTNTYFLNGLLIDTDMPGTLPGLKNALKENGLTLSDVRFVAATHYHPDHMGLIGELMTYGVKWVLFDNQCGYIGFSDDIFRRRKGLNYEPLRAENATVIRTEDSRAFFATLGIGGTVVKTESHSPDGIALITDDGECYAGDLAPYALIGAYGDDEALKRDWDTILSYRPRIAYFGHVNAQKL